MKGLLLTLTSVRISLFVRVRAPTSRIDFAPEDVLRYRAIMMAGPNVSRPVVLAVRHAQSVANVVKEKRTQWYYMNGWLDDSEKPASERLRDCVLSHEGIQSTLAAAEAMVRSRLPESQS